MKNKRLLFLIGSLIFIGILVALSIVTPTTVDSTTYVPKIYSTFGALLPPIIAIVLALITKEVYSSLFVGIATGALLYSNGNFILSLKVALFNKDGGLISKLSDSDNVGILVFLVILGVLVALMNKVGGSAAFGKWASKHIKTRTGAQLATMLLGIMIFVDDYFNCLTVGSVMKPVTDRHKISRAKLAYLIDATAAPICIIAPVSSWAAAVTSSVPEDSNINGFSTFLRTIPYNFYALLTLAMILIIVLRKFDFASMKKHEANAMNGDLFTTPDRPYKEDTEDTSDKKGKVIDLVFPVIVLITCCVIGMIYTGGFFSGESFIDAFANASASQGLVYGSVATLLITFIFYMSRGVITLKDFAECIPEGFKAMVAPILILTMAWTLSGMTGLLGAKFYVRDLVASSAGSISIFLPAVIFVVAAFLAFATGTSWGTFSILIPIVCNVFSEPSMNNMLVISIAACLSGAVCGDHCSPISDTTIMASAGAQSSHVNHVSTQLPYAILVASVSVVGYLLIGLLDFLKAPTIIALPVSFALLFIVLNVIKTKSEKKEKTN